MRTFFRIVAGFLFILVFVIFLFLTTIRFKFLDPNFVNVTLRDSDVYPKIEYLVKSALQERLQEELREKGDEFAQMPIEQQELVIEMMRNTVSAVTSDTVQDFMETNIVRFWGYFKGEEASIALYLPVRRWGVPELIIQSAGMAQFSENTNIEVFVSEPREVEDFYKTINSIREVVLALNNIWAVSLVVLIILFVLHTLLTKSPGKIIWMAYLFLITGAITLLLSGGVFLLANKAMSEVGDLVEPAKLLINAIIPQLVLGVVKLWLLFGGGFLAVGVLAFVFNYLLQRKKAAQT